MKEVVGILAKHGVAVAAGFLAGLMAVAIVQPLTLDGTLLLMVTVTAFVIVLAEGVMALLRLRPRTPSGREEAPDADHPDGACPQELRRRPRAATWLRRTRRAKPR